MVNGANLRWDIPAHAALAVRHRGGRLENVHRGSLVAFNAQGEMLLSVGEPAAVIYPRSALKPFQLLAMTRLGLRLPAQLLALAAGSHSGSLRHVEAGLALLSRYGLVESELATPAELPLGPTERFDWIRAGAGPSTLTHPCSGKHAAMLATCVVNGWDRKDYLDLEHPLQLEIRATIEAAIGAPVNGVGIDGCGAPAFAVPLAAITKAFGRLAATSADSSEAAIAEAMREHPDLVAGAERDVTAAMRAIPGLLAKDGADGVQLFGLPSGSAIGLKIADGADGPRMPVTLVALQEAFSIALPDSLRQSLPKDLDVLPLKSSVAT